VQFYTGGTVTYSNGYIVHNFTASGTLAPTTPTVVSEYQISRSLRFNSADSAYLNRTPASASNRKTWTLSTWIKRSKLSIDSTILSVGYPTSPWFVLQFLASNNVLQIAATAGASASWSTAAVFRDISAWYHIVCVVDTTSATATITNTATDRFRLYVNNVQQTLSGGTVPTQNADLQVNNTVAHSIGGYTSEYFDGYQTEVNFIDGQALTPTSFGYVNPTTGIWSPAKFVGGYGTNGFYLNFSDNSNTTAATLGKDNSGNGNNWTPNNFSVTAGAGNDSLVDSPTSYGVDTGVGGEVRGNYCTLNPISTAGGTFTNGNLDWASPSTDGRFCLSTISVNNMNCYCEVTIGSATSFQQVGVYGNATTFNPRVQYRSDGQASVDGTTIATYASFTTNDIIGIAYNSSTGSTSFYKNGSLQGSMTATSATVTQYFAAGSNSSGAAANYTFNFGQRPFSYTAPSGFKALCTQNLPTPTIGATSATLATQYFNPVLYTGTGASRSVTGLSFAPDFVWIKSRSTADYHWLFDKLRGVTNAMFSNTATAENNYNTSLTAFNSDGFSTGAEGGVNGSGQSMVAWNWKANGTGVSNTSGSITSSVSANTTSGFSVVTYTGSGSTATVGHGLGAVPSMVIVKKRSAATGWQVYNQTLGRNKVIYLDLNVAADTGANYWGTSDPTSSVFGLSTDTSINGSGGTYVAYCFTPIAGYSLFGSYTGNGLADGTFVYTGFRPAYVMIKRTDGVGSWCIYDAARSAFNVVGNQLYAQLALAEDTGQNAIDFLSNGFKIRTTDNALNSSGANEIYMAFASNPFKYGLAR
jgi:hypothetical protein